MKVLVTGSRGLLGRYLCAHLLAHHHEVVEYDLVLGRDVRDERGLAAAFADVDGLVHLASPSSSILFDADPLGCWAATLDPLATMLRDFTGRVVVPSSGTVYGDASPTSREDSWLPPVSSIYARAKQESERLVLHARAVGASASVLRVFTGYGGHEGHKVGYASQPFMLVEAALRHRTFDVFGDGEQSRDFVHALDVARAIRLMLEADDCPPVINVGSGHATSVNHLIRLVRQVTGRALDVRHTERPAAYVASTCADVSLARRALGFVPAVALADGLAETRDLVAQTTGTLDLHTGPTTDAA